MLFPEAKRVIYRKNPLNQVICQLRFPPILKIDADLPADFQEKIRNLYPDFKEQRINQFQVPHEIERQMPQSVVESLLGSSNHAYDFVSEDKNWTVRLTRDFIALTCDKYTKWEEFRDHLSVSWTALKDVYNPAFFSRVGLRYQNVICRSELDLPQGNWKELLNPHILGELASNDAEVTESIQERLCQSLFLLNDINSQVRIRHGLATRDGSEEICYLIDSDFFTENRTETEDVFNILNNFNHQNRNFFHWCITERLHKAMEPELIS